MADANKRDSNRDPISGAPGAHPVGTGIGAAGAGAAGAAIGAVAGPVGAVVGAAIGAIAGGLAGKGVAEYIDPTAENDYWRNNHKTRPYVENDHDYDRDLAPAYRYGWESRSRYDGRRFDEVESDLGRDWDRTRGTSSLTWDKAKFATRDAWDRVESKVTGDRDRVGTTAGTVGTTGTMGTTGTTGVTGTTGYGSTPSHANDTDKNRGTGGGSCNV